MPADWPRAADTSTRRLPRAGAFTLIELLMVLGMLMVLVGLALPSLSRAIGLARTTRQLAGVKQTVDLLAMYAHQFKEAYPMSGDAVAADASFNFHRALIASGLIESLKEIDPGSSLVDRTILMSECLVADAAFFRPSFTVHPRELPARAVRTTEVVHPSRKGSVVGFFVTDGRINSYWCCVDGMPRGPVGFCDASAEIVYWRNLLPRGELYLENGIGSPVISTWYGYRGRDRQN
jgi:type II secretory pathway pseudopilin PulG